MRVHSATTYWYDVAKGIAEELAPAHPAPVPRSHGMDIWEEARGLALPIVSAFSVEALLQNLEELFYDIYGSDLSKLLKALEPYDDSARSGGVKQALVELISELISDQVQRLVMRRR